MKEKYNFGSGECNATCGLRGLTWKTLGRKDKGRIIIASAIFALFLIMALLMIIIGLDKQYRFYLYIPLSVSFVVGGQVLALWVKEAFKEIVLGKASKGTLISVLKLITISSILAAGVTALFVYIIP